MLVGHIALSDYMGGAARAASRVHQALLSADVKSRMYVVKKGSDVPGVVCPVPSSREILRVARVRAVHAILRRLYPETETHRSVAAVGCGLVEAAARDNCNILNLHWIGDESVSLAELRRCSVPIVWRVADMWPFCGAEHYAPDDVDARWRRGYEGHDLDAVTWRRKRELASKKRIHFVATSTYVAECLRTSALYTGADVTVIPNPVDTNAFRPHEMRAARRILGLPMDRKLVLFGAAGGVNDPRKGWDLLVAAIESARTQDPQIECVIFGQKRPNSVSFPFPTHWLGKLQDDISLALAYSSADVMAVPSRQETFGQTVTESLACGTPVVGFRLGGLVDTVGDFEVGRLAVPFDVAGLAQCLVWTLGVGKAAMSERCRESAESRYSYRTVASMYRDLYTRILSSS